MRSGELRCCQAAWLLSVTTHGDRGGCGRRWAPFCTTACAPPGLAGGNSSRRHRKRSSTCLGCSCACCTAYSIRCCCFPAGYINEGLVHALLYADAHVTFLAEQRASLHPQPIISHSWHRSQAIRPLEVWTSLIMEGLLDLGCSNPCLAVSLCGLCGAPVQCPRRGVGAGGHGADATRGAGVRFPRLAVPRRRHARGAAAAAAHPGRQPAARLRRLVVSCSQDV